MKLLKKGFLLFTPIVLGSAVGFIISKSIDYTYLIKPPFAPPKFLFPVAWTVIYILMGVSFYILKKNYDGNLKSESIIYYLQLVVNLLWSIIFFTLKWRILSSAWIILLDILVLIMIKKFKDKEKIAAYLNIPYLIWILFASYLTIGITILN